jgi:hypothetical protein
MRGVQGPLFREKKSACLACFGFKNTRTAPVSEKHRRTHSLRAITLLTLLFSPVERRFLEAPRLEVCVIKTHTRIGRMMMMLLTLLFRPPGPLPPPPFPKKIVRTFFSFS